MKRLLLGSTLAFCAPTYADNYLSFKAPNKADAETWLNAFTDAQDMTRDGIAVRRLHEIGRVGQLVLANTTIAHYRSNE
ncbi:hypothetical protein [Methylomonas sp. ZR1]|uniref:hypothetical protein n=1 Tax=Methylomonas sp. ZR1 TaxID=1797072 RepID=UPI001491A3B1|nr:hypothetical protein [Methylomonas sp. ZR1]NOV29996.1 hypothetical protein [Methylomonas sp. ZR1]